MSPTWNVRLPEFHADSAKYSQESWEDYETSLQWAYEGSGVAQIDDTVKRAHLLTGLQGKAKQVLRLNPQWKNLAYPELLQQLRRKFGQPSWKNLEEIGKVIQRPGESVVEFLARLREAARATNVLDEYPLMTKKEAKAMVKASEGTLVAVPEEEVQKEKDLYSKLIDRFIFGYFIRGLQPKIQSAVINACPKTFKQAIGKAEETEKYLDLFQATTSDMGYFALRVARCNQESDHLISMKEQVAPTQEE